MNTENSRIEVKEDYDRFKRGEVVLGDLTAKQYAALEDVARLSPGYRFTVVRYEGGPSSTATHVQIWSEANQDDYVGLVGGKDCAQYYDRSKETENVVRRVSQRVYHRSVQFG